MDWVLRFTGFSFLFLLSPLFFKYCTMHRRTVYKSGSSKLEKVVGKADKTCFITGTFIKHGNVGELQTDCYIRVCGSTAVTQPSKHSTKKQRVYVQICWYHKTASQTRPAFPRTPWRCWCRNKGELFELMRFFLKIRPWFQSHAV